jgi:hypothetical protein
LNGSVTVEWTANFSSLGRSVLHVVVDTTDTPSTNRVRLYVNGVLQTATGGTQPAQNATINIGTGNSICLGNRDTQGRSMDGAIYYAALYANSLSATQVTDNSKILMAWDDK